MSMKRDYSIDDARDALDAIDPGLPRKDWVAAGMAAHAAGLDVDDFIRWSSQGGNFAGERDCRQVWKSFHAGGISAGTLYHLAKESGWEPRPADSLRMDAPRGRAEAAPARAAPKPADQGPTKQQIEYWTRKLHELLEAARDADPDHPYLARKDVWVDGLLSIPLAALRTILNYTPESKRGELAGDVILLAPLHAGDGIPRQVEMIDADGRKVMLPKLPKAGLMWSAVPLDPDATRIGIAEGMATCKTILEATGITVVAAGAANNLANVAKVVRKTCPGAEIVVFADAGRGEEPAQEAAAAVMGYSLVPAPTMLREGDSDFNDVAAAVGREALTTWLESHMRHPQRITFAQARTRVEIDYVLPGLPAGSVGLLVGPGSVGKSFLSLELAASIAIGRSLPRLPGSLGTLPQGRAAVLFGEDDADQMNNRMHSMIESFMLTDKDIAKLDENLWTYSLVGDDMRLVQVDQRSVAAGPFVQRLAHICYGRRIVFVDPLIRLHDGDENDNTAASHLMLTIARIAKDTRCSIVLLHHVGKGDRDGWAAARGASAITTTARWQLNVFPPNQAEIEQYGLNEESAKLYMKCVGVKMNYGKGLNTFWLQRDSHGVQAYIDMDGFGAQPRGGATDPFREAERPGSSRNDGPKPRGYQGRTAVHQPD